MGISVKEAITLIKHAPPDAIIGLVGPPGFGKSAAPRQAAAEMGWHYVCRYLAIMEAVEINGLPHLSDGSGKWAPFAGLFPLVGDTQYDDKPVLLTLDDIGQASPSVTKGGIRTAYGDGIERMVGMAQLHPNTRVCFTSNLHTHRAGAHRFESYVTNRVCMVEVEPSYAEWIPWAIANNVEPSVVAYVKFTQKVTDFAPDRDSFMSPRSLVALSNLVHSLDKAGVNGSILRAVACGTIGIEAGTEFLAYHALGKDLPDMDAVLRGEKVELPHRAEVQYMFITAFIQAAQPTDAHIKVAAQLIKRLTDMGGTGFEVAAFLTFEALKGSAMQKFAKLRVQPELYKWLGEYGKYLQ